MILLASCSDTTPTPTILATTDSLSITQSPTVASTHTSTPFPPSPTPVPQAVQVNGEGLTLVEFQAELARYRAAQTEVGSGTAEKTEEAVLDDLINQILLAQGARDAGFVADDALVDERWEQLVTEAGGEQAVQGWLLDNGYTVDSFRQALARSIAGAWMRDQITAEVPERAEQVHARQILLYNFEQAQEVLTQLESGNDFATIAATFDPVTSGDLGWFPRGYLVDVQLEEAVFYLQPLEYSDIVETQLGFHILQLIASDSGRLLAPDARLVLHAKALQDWLENQRSQSKIIVLLPDT